jgi:hypothetical protein
MVIGFNYPRFPDGQQNKDLRDIPAYIPFFSNYLGELGFHERKLKLSLFHTSLLKILSVNYPLTETFAFHGLVACCHLC